MAWHGTACDGMERCDEGWALLAPVGCLFDLGHGKGGKEFGDLRLAWCRSHDG
jgi:hypothetical protein